MTRESLREEVREDEDDSPPSADRTCTLIKISERGYKCPMTTGSNVCLIPAPTSCNRLSPLVRFVVPCCAQGVTPTSTTRDARSSDTPWRLRGSRGPKMDTDMDVRP